MGIIRKILPLAMSLLLVAAGCSKVDDIKINSCKIESFSPKGLRAANAVLAIEVDNPVFAFRISDIEGVIKYKGEDFATFIADGLSVDRKSVKVYELPCEASLAEGVSFLNFLSAAGRMSLKGFTTDIKAKVKMKNGLGKTLEFKDLKLDELSSGKSGDSGQKTEI